MVFMKDKPGKLYVSGLPQSLDEKGLGLAFAKFGPISDVLIVRDKMSNESKCFGFVTFESPADADDAVKGMDAQELDGSKLRVEEATISKSRSSAMRGGGGGMRGHPRRSSPRGGFRGGYRGRENGGHGGGYSRGPPARAPARDRMSPRPFRDGPPRDSRRALTPPPRDRGMPIRDSRGPPPRGAVGRDRGAPYDGYRSRSPPPMREYDSYGGRDSRYSAPEPMDYRSPPMSRSGADTYRSSDRYSSREERDYLPPPRETYSARSSDYPPSREYGASREMVPAREHYSGSSGRDYGGSSRYDSYGERKEYSSMNSSRSSGYGGSRDYDAPRDTGMTGYGRSSDRYEDSRDDRRRPMMDMGPPAKRNRSDMGSSRGGSSYRGGSSSYRGSSNSGYRGRGRGRGGHSRR